MSDDMHHVLPRFTQTAITTDPLEAALARREAALNEAREAIRNQARELRQPLNPRGWPISTQGVSGTSPGTDPAKAILNADRRACYRP